jgi:hypothetical protein
VIPAIPEHTGPIFNLHKNTDTVVTYDGICDLVPDPTAAMQFPEITNAAISPHPLIAARKQVALLSPDREGAAG